MFDPAPDLTERRILQIMAVLAVLGSAVAFWGWGWLALGGFIVGAVGSYFNFRGLTRVALAIGSTESGAQPLRPAGAIVLALRYLIFAAVGYAIFIVSGTAFRAALAGVFIHIAAVLVETVFELFFYARTP